MSLFKLPLLNLTERNHQRPAKSITASLFSQDAMVGDKVITKGAMQLKRLLFVD